MIIKKANEIGCKKIGAIPNSFEKLTTINIDNLKFIDSAQFMAESIEKNLQIIYTWMKAYREINI